jgi:RHS repeat-associated protein
LLLCGVLLAALPALGLAQGVKVEYAHLDGIGNVLAVSNSAGAEIESHDYLPYGEEWCGTSVCGSVKAGQSRRFTGKERDAETGLDYFGARYFASKVGRFTTVDPAYTWEGNLVDPQRWNRYAYVRNNPLRYTDPDGRVILDYQAFKGYVREASSFGQDGHGYLVPVVAGIAAAGSVAGDVTLAAGAVKLFQLGRAALSLGASAEASTLAARAEELHGLVGKVTQDKTTIAIARVAGADGTASAIVASSERVLRPVQRAALRAGEVAASGAGHAEVTAINAARAAGQTITEVAASRPICPSCATAIRQAGAKIVSEIK